MRGCRGFGGGGWQCGGFKVKDAEVPEVPVIYGGFATVDIFVFVFVVVIVISRRRDNDSRGLRCRWRRGGLGRGATRTVFRNGVGHGQMNHDSRGLWYRRRSLLGRSCARAVLASMQLVMFVSAVALRSSSSRDSNDCRNCSGLGDRLYVCDCQHLCLLLLHGDLLLCKLGLGGRECRGHDDGFRFCRADVADIDAATK